MKTRYVIIERKKRDDFEKEWHLPYGYGECYITFDFDEAINSLRVGESIEKIDDFGREIVYER